MPDKISTLKPVILDILQASDLGSVSTKNVRCELQGNVAYSKHVPSSVAIEGADKRSINSLIKKCFIELQSGAILTASAGAHPVVPVATVKQGTKKKSSPTNQPDNSPPAKKQRKRRTTPEAKPKRIVHPNNAFSAPLTLDEPLAAICGGNDIPRYEIIRRIWTYIKGNNLQDPVEKRTIICDETLRTIIPRERIDSFEVAKFIGPHVTRKPRQDVSPTAPGSTTQKESDSESNDSKKRPLGKTNPREEEEEEEQDEIEE